MTGLTLKIGGKELAATDQTTKMQRLSMLLWGPAGHGKTALAETMPGEKVWINFDPDGTAALTYNRGNVHVFDLASYRDDITDAFKSPDPLGIGAMLDANPQIESVIVDSLTTFGDKALHHGVVKARATKKGASSTIEDPGYAGYGQKNTLVQELVTKMLAVTGQRNRHIAFTAHEDKPQTNEDGAVTGSTLMLGSSLVIQIPTKISEVWYISDTGKERRIAIRPCRGHSPMRTRMFFTNQQPEFLNPYNADTNKGDGIAEWYAKWRDNGFRKIDVPK